MFKPEASKIYLKKKDKKTRNQIASGEKIIAFSIKELFDVSFSSISNQFR